MPWIKKTVKKIRVETSPRLKIKEERKKRNARTDSAVQKQIDNGKHW